MSVDAPETSEALRGQISLPFTILCDTEKRLIRDWDLYNERERGGIAKPAVFVIDPNLVVRYASIDSVATRVPASEIVRFLNRSSEPGGVCRHICLPRPSQWLEAIRNNFRR